MTSNNIPSSYVGLRFGTRLKFERLKFDSAVWDRMVTFATHFGLYRDLLSCIRIVRFIMH